MGRRAAQDQPRRFSWINTTGVPVWVFVVLGAAVLFIVAAGVYVVVQMITADEPVRATPELIQSTARPSAAASRSASPAPRPRPADALVANAQRIKPLEDIKKGDRVIYQGHVCTWQLWNKNINTSTIKCPGTKAFQIQTGRLTPVELKAGPSKLKIKH